MSKISSPGEQSRDPSQEERSIIEGETSRKSQSSKFVNEIPFFAPGNLIQIQDANYEPSALSPGRKKKRVLLKRKVNLDLPQIVTQRRPRVH